MLQRDNTPADLELREDRPQLLPPIKIPRAAVSPRSDDHGSSSEGSNAEGPGTAPDSEDADCRTPTSSEHKIPQVLECPPAPKKPARTVSRKRKASDLRAGLFDAVNREELESFFRRFEGGANNSSSAREVVKIRRSSCKGFAVQFQ